MTDLSLEVGFNLTPLLSTPLQWPLLIQTPFGEINVLIGLARIKNRIKSRMQGSAQERFTQDHFFFFFIPT